MQDGILSCFASSNKHQLYQNVSGSIMIWSLSSITMSCKAAILNMAQSYCSYCNFGLAQIDSLLMLCCREEGIYLKDLLVHGKIRYSNGHHYEGSVLDGHRSGHGIYTWAPDSAK